ncbi:MAG: hypothetical protein A2033_15085 [Bacteroidetes bacterium GWA2_31_9]|nr:MAG: hypothetical protein A2033_15085 [Bacteroidetes bacterium GWA2_31_9]
MECKYCKSKCIKKGIRNKIQRFRCVCCNKYQQLCYSYNTSKKDFVLIKTLNNEGVGISSISRIMKIPKTTVQRLIEIISRTLKKPELTETNQSYEIDELRTYVGNKKNESWLMYAINKSSGVVVDFAVGRRTKENLKKVVTSVIRLNPKKIYTDGLNIYNSLIPKPIHKVFQYNINKIERNNLTLRTHIKRLTRRTICFSKSEAMLENCLRLYVISNTN